MRRRAREFRAEARKALDGRYWWAVLASIIAGVLGGTSSGSSGASTGASTGASANYSLGAGDVQNFQNGLGLQLDGQMSGALVAIIGVVVSILMLAGIVLFLIGGAVELGYNSYNIRLYQTRETPSLKELFSRFSIFGRALWLRVLTSLKIIAWMLLFIVPGIIAAYRYALAPFIMAENPELTASQAIDKSKAMMAGNKGRLFCLQFSFFGWYILGAFTLGIGFIFLAPYVKAAETAFYMELSGQLPGEPAAQTAAVPVAEVAPEDGPQQV